MPNLYILSGCNGAGKTTSSYTLLPELFHCSEFVNSDEFAKSLSPFDPSAVAVLASKYMLIKIHYLLDRSMDFCIETTLATRSLVGIIRQARQKNYTVTVLYFWLNSPEMAIQRVRDRVAKGGHNIPEETIRRRYVMGLKYLFETYIPICDSWFLCDNSTQPFIRIASGDKNSTTIEDESRYNTIRKILSSAPATESDNSKSVK